MGIMRTLSGLSKEEREKAHKEYLERRNRLREAQKPPKTKAPRKQKPRAGKVVTYHISELEQNK